MWCKLLAVIASSSLYDYILLNLYTLYIHRNVSLEVMEDNSSEAILLIYLCRTLL